MIAGFAEAMSHEARHAWNIRQVYIALGQLMTSAAVLGIDACPMEGISAAAYDRVLGLEGPATPPSSPAPSATARRTTNTPARPRPASTAHR